MKAGVSVGGERGVTFINVESLSNLIYNIKNVVSVALGYEKLRVFLLTFWHRFRVLGRRNVSSDCERVKRNQFEIRRREFVKGR